MAIDSFLPIVIIALSIFLLFLQTRMGVSLLLLAIAGLLPLVSEPLPYNSSPLYISGVILLITLVVSYTLRKQQTGRLIAHIVPAIIWSLLASAVVIRISQSSYANSYIVGYLKDFYVELLFLAIIFGVNETVFTKRKRKN